MFKYVGKALLQLKTRSSGRTYDTHLCSRYSHGGWRKFRNHTWCKILTNFDHMLKKVTVLNQICCTWNVTVSRDIKTLQNPHSQMSDRQQETLYIK